MFSFSERIVLRLVLEGVGVSAGGGGNTGGRARGLRVVEVCLLRNVLLLVAVFHPAVNVIKLSLSLAVAWQLYLNKLECFWRSLIFTSEAKTCPSGA